MRIEIVDNDTELERRVYIFWVNTDCGRIELILDDYTLEKKESTRKRKFHKVEWYSRIGDQRMAICKILKKEDVVVGLLTKNKAINKLMSEVKL